MNKISIKIVLSLFVVSLLSCENLDKFDETGSLTNPTGARVLSSADDLPSLLRGGYLEWWQGIHDDHPAMALAVTSDQIGLSWGNFGMRRMGEEPRQPYNNRASEAQDYKQLVEDPWFGCYTAIAIANNVLGALDAGVSIDDGGDADRSLRASALLLRGLANGYLGLMFDQAFNVDETTDIEAPVPFSTYEEMVDAGIADLGVAITEAQGATAFVAHTYFNGLTLDAAQFIELAHSYRARFEASWPRTEAEAANIDWAFVETETAAGLTYDFAPIADGNFWDSYQKFAFADANQGPFWAHTDQRIISAMDPSFPSRYPIGSQQTPPVEPPLPNDGIATTDDERLASDFVYVAPGDINLPIDRGEWHFSTYKHNRNQTDPTFSGDGSSFGPMPVFRVADNDLLRAEALLNTADPAGAIAIINAGTRVTRGDLTPLAGGATFDEIEYAIMYERAIELMSTGPGQMWFDRRRIGPRLPFDQVDDLGGLQSGTPAHLPVPADELAIIEEPPYNFGGSQDPEGTMRIF